MAKFNAPKGHATSSTHHSRAAVARHAAKPTANMAQRLIAMESGMDKKGGPKTAREVGLENKIQQLTGKPDPQ